MKVEVSIEVHVKSDSGNGPFLSTRANIVVDHPGESPERAVYDLTCRALEAVRPDVHEAS